MSAADIVARYGTSLVDDTSEPGRVTVDRLPRTKARALVAELRATGLEASDAPDAEDSDMSWVYVR